MEPRSLRFVARACGGELVGLGNRESVCTDVCTDSRRLQTGDVFFALVGDRFDGHAFLADVARKGAAAAVIRRDRLPGDWSDCPLVLVDDTKAALGKLAAAYRTEWQVLVVAVAGSNGKTTTKDLLAGVLGQRFRVLSSEASFNNDVGVPVTLLRLDRSHEVAVLEVGTNHPGELAPLLQMIQPQFGALTSLGREHLEFFGDLNGVITEEGTLAELLPAGGKFFANAESPGLDQVTRRCRAPVVTVGFGSGSDWKASDVRMDLGGVSFWVIGRDRSFDGEYRLPLLGRHQVTNALLAIAVGAELGLTPAQVSAGLAGARPPRMRLEVLRVGGVTVLDDTYNANADSAIAALGVLGELDCVGRRVAVLGDLAELGEHTGAAHAEMGARASQCGVDVLVAVGRQAGATAEAARARGVKTVLEFPDAAAAGLAIKDLVRSGDVILLKASRASRLERLVEALAGEFGRGVVN